MEITVNNQHFKKLFLEQIGKISDSCVISLLNNKLRCKASSADNSVILGVELSLEDALDLQQEVFLNVGDIKKLIRAFDCVGEERVTFNIENNNINYKDKNIKFKYHLLEDGIINQPKVNLEKLQQLEFDSNFTLEDRSLNDLVKCSTFSTDSNKIYLTSEGTRLKGDLTDRTKCNVDNLELKVSNNFMGTPISNMCLNFEVFRIISTCKFNALQCNISSKLGVVLFAFTNNIITVKYIVSALTK